MRLLTGISPRNRAFVACLAHTAGSTASLFVGTVLSQVRQHGSGASASLEDDLHSLFGNANAVSHTTAATARGNESSDDRGYSQVNNANSGGDHPRSSGRGNGYRGDNHRRYPNGDRQSNGIDTNTTTEANTRKSDTGFVGAPFSRAPNRGGFSAARGGGGRGRGGGSSRGGGGGGGWQSGSTHSSMPSRPGYRVFVNINAKSDSGSARGGGRGRSRGGRGGRGSSSSPDANAFIFIPESAFIDNLIPLHSFIDTNLIDHHLLAFDVWGVASWREGVDPRTAIKMAEAAEEKKLGGLDKLLESCLASSGESSFYGTSSSGSAVTNSIAMARVLRARERALASVSARSPAAALTADHRLAGSILIQWPNVRNYSKQWARLQVTEAFLLKHLKEQLRDQLERRGGIARFCRSQPDFFGVKKELGKTVIYLQPMSAEVIQQRHFKLREDAKREEAKRNEIEGFNFWRQGGGGDKSAKTFSASQSDRRDPQHSSSSASLLGGGDGSSGGHHSAQGTGDSSVNKNNNYTSTPMSEDSHGRGHDTRNNNRHDSSREDATLNTNSNTNNTATYSNSARNGRGYGHQGGQGGGGRGGGEWRRGGGSSNGSRPHNINAETIKKSFVTLSVPNEMPLFASAVSSALLQSFGVVGWAAGVDFAGQGNGTNTFNSVSTKANVGAASATVALRLGGAVGISESSFGIEGFATEENEVMQMISRELGLNLVGNGDSTPRTDSVTAGRPEVVAMSSGNTTPQKQQHQQHKSSVTFPSSFSITDVQTWGDPEDSSNWFLSVQDLELELKSAIHRAKGFTPSASDVANDKDYQRVVYAWRNYDAFMSKIVIETALKNLGL